MTPRDRMSRNFLFAAATDGVVPSKVDVEK